MRGVSSEKTLAILFDKIASYVESLCCRDPGHVLRAPGPKTVDSTIASEILRGLRGAHLRSPTGLIEQFRISPQGGMVGGNSYLRIRNVLELLYIKVGVI